MNTESVTVGIVGAGIMGGGIAQAAAMSGFKVLLYARRPAALEDTFTSIGASLKKLYEKGKVAEEPATILARITPCHDMAVLSLCSLVVEAIAEQLETKCALLQQLGRLMREEAVLATTTTSLSVTTLGAASGVAERFIGMHFMNPVPLMEVVELIPGELTADAAITFARDFVGALGKVSVISRDCPGFIVSRLLIPPINEAFEMLREGVASAEEIDTAMKLGANHPMGPLALGDLIGLDVVLAAMETLAAGLGQRFAPSPLLREYVEKGRLGRKNGQGVYGYPR